MAKKKRAVKNSAGSLSKALDRLSPAKVARERAAARERMSISAAKQRKAAEKRRLAEEKKQRAKKSNPARRSNPADLAAKKYEQFHGHPPGEVITVKTPLHVHEFLPGIGKLVKLIIKPAYASGVVELMNFEQGGKPAYLAESEGTHGPQLYIEGGDQAVNLKAFGISRPHENELLGAATWVWYDTEKTHLRPEDGGKAIYRHRFGYTRDAEGRHVKKPGAKQPLVWYDVRNKLLHFVGGGYTIPSVGIDG